MAKKVEIVALVSVLGQPSYDKSRWANFFGEKLAKVTKGKDKIAAINAMIAPRHNDRAIIAPRRMLTLVLI